MVLDHLLDQGLYLGFRRFAGLGVRRLEFILAIESPDPELAGRI